MRMLESDKDANIIVAKAVAFENVASVKLSEMLLPKYNKNFVGLSEENFFAHTQDAIPYLICSNNAHTLWAKVYRKQLLLSINLNFPENDAFPYEGVDQLWLPLIFAFAKKILLLNDFVYLYNHRIGSMSYDLKMIRQNPPNQQWEWFIISWWKEKFELLAKNNLISLVGSPIIKLLREHYYHTTFANAKWIKENFLDKYKINLMNDNYSVNIRKS